MKKFNLSQIMKRAWEIKKENTENIFAECLRMAWMEAKKSVAVEKTLKDKIIDKLNFIIDNAPDVYIYSVSVSGWANYGKDRTYFAIWEKSNVSKHNVKYDYGYIDNQTGIYVAGRHDITKNYSLGGRSHLDYSIEF